MSLKVSRILHAGYVFECDGVKVAFDPIFEETFSVNCHAFPPVKFDRAQIKSLKFSAVFISHFHDDHCSLESLALLDRQTPIYIYCVFEELFAMIRELGFTHVQALELNIPVRVGPMEIIPRQALDADVDSLFHIRADGLNVLNVVDSWIDDYTLNSLVRANEWDLVLWPFQTMRELEVIAPSRAVVSSRKLPPEWLAQLQLLNPRFIVPSSCQFSMESWSWYNLAFFPITYQQFQQEVGQALSHAQIFRMDPSRSIVLEKGSVSWAAPLEWVKLLSEQETDYEYQPNLRPPPTSEIAKQFPPLTEVQSLRVLAYCRSGLLEKFRSLAPSEEPYFMAPRTWQLSLYDHQGLAMHFYYQLDGACIERTSEPTEAVSWLTEVSMAKLYGALERGETLTSMYLRINDRVFDAKVEDEISSVDLVEDPLLRCLFNGAFGAYQKAQLKRLLLKP